MSKIHYRQCRLIKKIKNREKIGDYYKFIEKTTYIPEKYAQEGKYVKLKENGAWINGWCIAEVGTRLIEEVLPDPREDIKGHRHMTGDSLPKGK